MNVLVILSFVNSLAETKKTFRMIFRRPEIVKIDKYIPF